MAAKHYDDGDIQILSGLDPVRKRPGMYIGSTDSRGLHYLIWELVDNAIDEALAGYGKEITVSLNQDGSVTVSDQGRGVPCGLNKETGLNSLEVIYSILHFIGYSGDNLGLIYLCGKPSWLTVILYTIIVCVLIFKHKSNFKRLINGTENCFKHKKNKNQ